MPGRLAAAIQNDDAIKTAAFLTDSTKMRSILGAWNKYSRLVKDFSKIAGRSMAVY